MQEAEFNVDGAQAVLGEMFKNSRRRCARPV